MRLTRHPRRGCSIWVGGHDVEAKRIVLRYLRRPLHQPRGPLDIGFIVPNTTEEGLYFLKKLRTHIEQRSAWSPRLDDDWFAACDAEVKACVKVAESKPAADLADLFSDVYAKQPWHLQEQEASCLRSPRPSDEEEA